MAKRRRKMKLVALLPPKGPPTNVRPAGAHRDRREPGRDIVKIELRKFEQD